MTEKRFWLDEDGIHDKEYEFSILGEDELVDIINNLHEENQELKDLELEDRDITIRAGRYSLEEWGKHRYHQFYKDDEEVEDEGIVILLLEQEKEIRKLKSTVEALTFELKKIEYGDYQYVE